MPRQSISQPAGEQLAHGELAQAPALLLLIALLAASGCAALIYQVVWFQLLSLVIGASAVSLGVLLGTFMGGLCLGSLAFARWVPAAPRPLHLYAALELAIAGFAALVLLGMPALNGLYASLGGSGTAGIAVRAVVAAACLLPPTILMGATLPAAARALPSEPHGAARLGALYAANIAGAVAGSVLAGYYLLRVHDAAIATWVAAALNVGSAAAAFAAARASRASAAGGASRPSAADDSFADAPVYVATALSGMTALAAEVVWTRQLSLLLGSTVYAFALIVAVFLLGLGLGSGAGTLAARRWPPRVALGGCQLALCAAVAWGAYALAEFLPYWPLDVTLAAPTAVTLQLDVLRAALAILPAALLWGASFPLALATAMDGGSAANAGRSLRPTAMDGGSAARLVGRLYAANTAGAIVGALGTSFALVVWLGSERTQALMILVCAASALLLLSTVRPAAPRARAAAACVVLAVAAALAYSVPPIPPELVAYGRFLPTRAAGSEILYVGEGLTASVAVSKQPNGALSYHNAGKTQASSYAQDMRLQRMLGHLTTLVPERNESFLVIGLGAGITAGAVAIDPAARRVVVAEIEPLSPRVAAEYFGAQNFDVVGSPKVEIRIDDGRHFLATTRETFDGITSDPLDPWVKGAAALYSREFWQLARSRPNPGGVVTVFLQLYESNDAAVRSEIATFFEVFPRGALFANTVQGAGYDAVLLGRAGDEPIDVDRVDARLRQTAYEPVARSLRQVGFSSAADLLGTYAGGASDLGAWLEGAAINTDRNLRLQYLAGEGLNESRAAPIMQDLLAAAAARSSSGTFTGAPETLRRLDQAIRAHAPRDRDDAFER